MREEILNVASLQFAKYGFKKTTLTDIASALGKQKTALYYYFKNKEDIFFEIISIEARSFVSQLKDVLTEDTDEVTKLKSYLRLRIQIMSEIAHKYKALKDELFFLLSHIESARTPYHQIECEELSILLESGKKKGVFSLNNPKQMATTIVNILKGLEIPMYIREDIGKEEEEVHDFIALIVKGLLNNTSLDKTF